MRRSLTPARLLLAHLLLLLASFAAMAQSMPEVFEIRFGIQGRATRVVLDSDMRFEATPAVLGNPSRLVIDLPEVRWMMKSPSAQGVVGLASAYRYGRIRPGRSRIVIDLKRSAEIAAAFWIPPNNSSRYWRYVIDVKDGPPPAPEPPPPPPPPVAKPVPPPVEKPVVKVEPPTKPSPPPAPTVAPTPPPRASVAPQTSTIRSGKPVIVIDPGHGGIDPGTVGIGDVKEKEIVLAMGLELKELLEQDGRYRVVMTRSTDNFLPLRERIRIARDADAALFLSLHADSLGEGTVQGASVYTLSENSSDEEAALLAAKENKADILAGTDLSVHDPIVAGILIDLAQRDTNNKSIAFADLLAADLGEVTKLLRNNRRFAGFAVLKSPETPSVLIEIGYLSNADDAKRLQDQEHRRKLGRAIMKAIDRHFADHK